MSNIALRKAILSDRRAKLPDEERALLEELLQSEFSIEDETVFQCLEQSPTPRSPTQLPGLPGQRTDPTRHLALALRQPGGEVASSSSSPICMQTGNSDKQPLFFVHPVSGDAWCYADLVRHLDPSRPFYGLQARGLDGEHPPHTQVEPMADYYVELLRTVQAEGPYLLGGWSMGGVVAFEMAQQLQTQGRTVALLVMIDSYRLTGDLELEAESDEADLLVNFALDLGLPLRRIKLGWKHLEQLTLNGRLAHVLEQAQETNILPPDIEPAQVHCLFRVFKSNFQAMGHYVPVTYAGPIALFRANEHFDDLDEDLGWDELAVGGLTVQVVPGDHYTMVREPNVKTLAERLNHQLDMIEVHDGHDMKPKNEVNAC